MKIDGFQGEMQAMMFEATNTKPAATGLVIQSVLILAIC